MGGEVDYTMRSDAGESARLNQAWQELGDWYKRLSQQKKELLNQTADEDSPLLEAIICVSSLRAIVHYGNHVIGLAARLFELSTQENKTWSDKQNITGYCMGVVRNAWLIPFRMVQLLDKAQDTVAVYSHLPDFEEIKRLISSIYTQVRESGALSKLCHALDQHYRAHIDNPVVGSLRLDTDIRYDAQYALINRVLELYQPVFELIKLVTAANDSLVKALPNPVVRLPDRKLPR
ncbi:hypothetical protein [Hymenobacter cellulosilyticus]|uniref:Uncharacterized protein n=1 Tax=Hymenobacter cellulosilyticus TaxID=2932248 RepID=A0A8T9Q339_9BACT|nr:hypothetical protein [Hymenobacter cellulosilyticus]UOQ70278.1 hypothetical protein MUN79_16145 [Hymenobacter cellulosilyticus]